jgi:hypothetical protein
MKIITEINDNISLINIRKKEFYDLKDNNNNTNYSSKNIQNNFDLKNKSLFEYVNYSPKLSIMVFKLFFAYALCLNFSSIMFRLLILIFYLKEKHLI